MNEILRKKLLDLDVEIYFLKWKQTRLLCEDKLKTAVSKDDKSKIFDKWIYHPFSSQYEAPQPSIVEIYGEINNE